MKTVQLTIYPGYAEALLRAVEAQNELLKDTMCPKIAARKVCETRELGFLHYVVELQAPAYWLTESKIFDLAWDASYQTHDRIYKEVHDKRK